MKRKVSLNRELAYFLTALTLGCNLTAQTVSLDLARGGCQVFHGKIYAYGLKTDQNHRPAICVYELNPQLLKTDSLLTTAGKEGPGTYLRVYSDTLHDYLNIYLQKAEKKTVTILRLTKQFKLLSIIENVDVARVNNTSLFDAGALYFQKTAYSIKTQTDSSGKQFYLNKYELKSDLENFDYEFKWQFAFERKNIRSAHIFFADTKSVMMYVQVGEGPKKGQWILAVDPVSGKLIRGTKLNDKGENNTCQFGNSYADPLYRSQVIMGQKFAGARENDQQNKPAASNATFVTMYYAKIDSLGELTEKQEFRIPIADVQANSRKNISAYIFRITSIHKNTNGGLQVETDIFKNSTTGLCFQYVNTIPFSISPVEDKLVIDKTPITIQPLIEEFYYTNDKLDMNGKLCSDSAQPFDKLFYMSMPFPAREHFWIDADHYQNWVLSKASVRKNTIQFAALRPEKKVYRLSTLQEIEKSKDPAGRMVSNNSYLISSQPEETRFELKLFTW